VQIFVHSVERLNSPVYSVPPCRYSLPIFVCFYFIFACFLSGLLIIFLALFTHGFEDDIQVNLG